MMNDKDADLLQKLKTQLINCDGWDGTQEQQDRKQANDYYFQRPRGDEVVGRSAVVAGDVSAMVEAVLSQMLDAFGSNHIAEFGPHGIADEDQAQLESDAVAYLIMEANNGFIELEQAIKDALMLRNGIMKCWVEERTETYVKSLQNVAPEALGEVANQPGFDKVLKYDTEKGGELKMRMKHTRREFKCRAVPIENFFYPSEFDSFDLQAVPFCAERHVDPRSELIELGFPKEKVNELRPYNQNLKIDGMARNPRSLSQTHHAIDESQDQIEWFEAYANFESDGVTMRHKVCFTTEVILSNEPARYVQYAGGAVIINPHRLKGISLFDKIKQTQDKNTGLERALLDNVNTVTKNRLAYLDGKANVDDVSDGRPNGAIRVKANVGDIRSAVMPFTVPDQSTGILKNIEYQKTLRAEMGGAALQMATGEMQLNDRLGSQGVDRMYSVQEALSALLTKNIAQTLIRSLFLLAHATLREFYNEPVPVKIDGNWQQPIPSKWPERRCVTVKPGMSPGERSRKASALQNILQSQIALADKGMDEVLVNIDGFYKCLMDWGRMVEVQNPEQYFRNPQSDEAKQAMQSKQAEAQKQTQMRQALMQQAIGLEQLRLGFDKYKQDSELQFKYYDAVLGAEVEEAKIAGKATTELVKAKAHGSREAKAGGAAVEGQPAAAGNSGGTAG
ncbi:MAG: hypothetical protein WD795_16410 [Woeseia sp.]